MCTCQKVNILKKQQIKKVLNYWGFYGHFALNVLLPRASLDPFGLQYRWASFMGSKK